MTGENAAPPARHGRRWYVAHWPPLAWLETVIKLVALAVGIAALFHALSKGSFALPAGVRLAQWVILVILSLGLVAAISDRIMEREIIAMGFVIVNNAGHWGMVVALAGKGGPGRSLVAFGALMLVGDVVKLLFLKVHHFTMRAVPRAVLYGLTLVYVGGYAAILLLEAAR